MGETRGCDQNLLLPARLCIAAGQRKLLAKWELGEAPRFPMPWQHTERPKLSFFLPGAPSDTLGWHRPEPKIAGSWGGGGQIDTDTQSYTP